MVSAEAPSLASVGAGGLGKEGRKKRGAVGGWMPPVVDMRGVLPSEPKYVSVSERSRLAVCCMVAFYGRLIARRYCYCNQVSYGEVRLSLSSILMRVLKGPTDGSLRERRFALSEVCLSAS